MTSNRPFVLSAQAAADLRAVIRYSTRSWGAGRSDRYAEALMNGLERIAQYPSLGRLRDDIAVDLRSVVIGEHIALYRVQ